MSKIQKNVPLIIKLAVLLIVVIACDLIIYDFYGTQEDNYANNTIYEAINYEHTALPIGTTVTYRNYVKATVYEDDYLTLKSFLDSNDCDYYHQKSRGKALLKVGNKQHDIVYAMKTEGSQLSDFSLAYTLLEGVDVPAVYEGGAVPTVISGYYFRNVKIGDEFSAVIGGKDYRCVAVGRIGVTSVIGLSTLDFYQGAIVVPTLDNGKILYETDINGESVTYIHIYSTSAEFYQLMEAEESIRGTYVIGGATLSGGTPSITSGYYDDHHAFEPLEVNWWELPLIVAVVLAVMTLLLLGKKPHKYIGLTLATLSFVIVTLVRYIAAIGTASFPYMIFQSYYGICFGIICGIFALAVIGNVIFDILSTRGKMGTSDYVDLTATDSAPNSSSAADDNHNDSTN